MMKRLSALAIAALLASCGDRETPDNQAKAVAPPTQEANMADAVPAPSPMPEPVFTSLARDDCELVEQNREEAGYARFLCEGRGGRRLEIVEADGREDLAVRRGEGEPQHLQLSSRVARGAFSRLGTSAEWIGADRLVVRYDVFEQEGKPPVSNLLVVDMGAQPACPVAKVPPGSGQNEEARRIAEAATLPACLPAP